MSPSDDLAFPEAGEGVRYHSYTALATYADVCGLQYRFRYLDRLAPERVSSALVFGSAVNAALLAIDADLVKGRAPRVEAACEVLRSRLEEAYAPGGLPVVSTRGESIEDLYARGARMLGLYAERLLPDEVPLDLPRRFVVPLLDDRGEALPRPLAGEFDRLVRTRAGRLAIVDWKTASSRWSPDRIRKDDQATAYLLAARFALGETPEFFRYEILLKTARPAIERHVVQRTDRDLRRFVRKVQVLDRAIRSGVFVPNDRSFACPTCPYRGACEKWQD
jgi:putative RecB family exonuclease